MSQTNYIKESILFLWEVAKSLLGYGKAFTLILKTRVSLFKISIRWISCSFWIEFDLQRGTSCIFRIITMSNPITCLTLSHFLFKIMLKQVLLENILKYLRRVNFSFPIPMKNRECHSLLLAEIIIPYPWRQIIN